MGASPLGSNAKSLVAIAFTLVAVVAALAMARAWGASNARQAASLARAELEATRRESALRKEIEGHKLARLKAETILEEKQRELAAILRSFEAPPQSPVGSSHGPTRRGNGERHTPPPEKTDSLDGITELPPYVPEAGDKKNLSLVP